MSYRYESGTDWWTRARSMYDSSSRFYYMDDWLSQELTRCLDDAIKDGIIYDDNGELRWNWKYENKKSKPFECKSLI